MKTILSHSMSYFLEELKTILPNKPIWYICKPTSLKYGHKKRDAYIDMFETISMFRDDVRGYTMTL